MQAKKSKKKLLITASTFPRYDNDTEPRFILDLAKALQEYFEVTVLVPADPGAVEEELLEGVRVKRYHYFPVHKLETLCYPGAIVPRIREKRIRGLLVPFLFVSYFYNVFKYREQFDCVHANWIIPQGIIQSYISLPYLLTGHGGDVTSLNAGVIRYFKKRAVKKAKAVTVVSEALKREVLGWFRPEEQVFIKDKLIVQPFGCDILRFGQGCRRDDLWGQGMRKVVLFVGRLVEKKGVRYLLEAMQWVDAQLIIIGDGPLRQELQSYASAKGLNGKVIFEGAKSHEELPEAYASADVLAMPSVTAKDKDKEGFGLVILEAMASGLPIAAFDSGGISEVIRHGYNGLLCAERDSVALAEHINRLLQEEELRRDIIHNMEITVKKYDYREVGRRYAELIQRM